MENQNMENQNTEHQSMESQPREDTSREHVRRAVQIQLRPSFEKILRQEARRRSSQLKAMINIGLGEVCSEKRPVPEKGSASKTDSVTQRWPVPTLDVRTNLLGLSTKLRKVGRGPGAAGSVRSQAHSFKGTLQDWRFLVSKRNRNREALWESAQIETPSRVVWARLAPAEAEGLGMRAAREDVPATRLLRRGLRRGVQKRNRMEEMNAHLRHWHRRVQTLSMNALWEAVSSHGGEDSSQPGSKTEKIGEKLRKIGREIERVVTDVEIG